MHFLTGIYVRVYSWMSLIFFVKVKYSIRPTVTTWQKKDNHAVQKTLKQRENVFILPHPQRWPISSWTFHTPDRTRCSLHSLQTWGKTVDRQMKSLKLHICIKKGLGNQVRGRWAPFTVKYRTPLGSSNSFSKDTAQLSTLLAGLTSPPGVPGRLELLLPHPRADMFSSSTHSDTNTPSYQQKGA